MPIQTVFLDAGGVLVNPNWTRVSDTLAVMASTYRPPHSRPPSRTRRRLDTGDRIAVTTDQQRGWTYFNLVLTEPVCRCRDATAAALAELHSYHQSVQPVGNGAR